MCLHIPTYVYTSSQQQTLHLASAQTGLLALPFPVNMLIFCVATLTLMLRMILVLSSVDILGDKWAESVLCEGIVEEELV